MFSLAQDAHGSLWVGAPGRLLRVSFDGAIDEWNRRRGDDQVPSGYIDILRIAPDGSLWLSSQGGGIQQRDVASGAVRSEEHTSELQSLMRISYAVFCLKKKNRKKPIKTE